MVDNILQEGKEVGYSSGEDDADLSGDEVKTPIFIIKKDSSRTNESAAGMMEDDADVEGSEDSDEELFVQEEYDLAANLD